MSCIAGRKIGFIGGGRMAEAILSGVLEAGVLPADHILVSDLREERLSVLSASYGITGIPAGGGGNKKLLDLADVLLLALEPQAAGSALAELQECFHKERHVLLSIMGGVSLEYLERYAGQMPVIRIMPNTPMLVGAGVAGIALGKFALEEHGRLASEIFNAVGISYLLPEHLIDPLTGVSGCGPAFAGMFIQALADGGVAMGLPREIAVRIAAQTLVGTGRMVLETNLHPEILKDNVCTPGGGTIAGVRALEDRALRGTVMSAVESSIMRMREVGKKA